MRRSLNEISGYALQSMDDDIGRCKDFLFDDRGWIVRYTAWPLTFCPKFWEILMINQTELQQFMQDPAQHFETPDAVIDSGKLDGAQKLQILKSWEDDEKNLQTAAAENMGGGESDILEKVVKAIIRAKELVK